MSNLNSDNTPETTATEQRTTLPLSAIRPSKDNPRRHAARIEAMVFPAIDATADAEPGNNNDDDQDESDSGAGGEPDTPPDCEEVVEVDPDEADALVDEGMGAAA